MLTGECVVKISLPVWENCKQKVNVLGRSSPHEQEENNTAKNTLKRTTREHRRIHALELVDIDLER